MLVSITMPGSYSTTRIHLDVRQHCYSPSQLGGAADIPDATTKNQRLGALPSRHAAAALKVRRLQHA